MYGRGVPEPLYEALLVDELDAACADAGVEQWLVRATLTPAHPAYVACNHIPGSAVEPFNYKDSVYTVPKIY
jgi:hypothetical protein